MSRTPVDYCTILGLLVQDIGMHAIAFMLSSTMMEMDFIPIG